MPDNPYRNLPAINDVLDSLSEAVAAHGREQVVAAVREELGELRQALAAGGSLDGTTDLAAVAARVNQRLAASLKPKLVRMINATGIVLHTNLGRAPIAAEAADAARAAAAGYLNLELSL